MKLNVRETTFVLAGLRSLQVLISRSDLPDAIVQILNDCDSIDGDRVNLEEIDSLCEKLNGCPYSE
ncbi:MAG: hypothetical protein JSS14_22200 [Proteobacteria bacterium]|nr:hypothetical protein [Pseudomonadota bacterium]